MYKRISAIILGAFLLMQVLSGCGTEIGKDTPDTSGTQTETTQAENTQAAVTAQGNVPEYLNTGSAFPIVKEGNDITIRFSNTLTSGFITNPEDIWFWKFVEEYCGFKVEVENILPDAVEERTTLMFASGDLPDIMFNPKINTTKIVTYGVEEHLLLPINDYVTDEIMPNYKATLEKYPDFLSICTAPDGKMYALGRKLTSDNPGALQTTGLNQGWLDKLGLKSPETIDEFIEVMRKFKSADPKALGVDKVIPMAGGYTSYPGILAFLNGMGYLATGANDRQLSGATVAVRNGKVTIPCMDDIYGEYVALCKLAYDEGLISSDFFTKDRAQCNAELGQEITGYVHTIPYAYAEGIKGEYLAIKPLTSQWNNTPIVETDNPYWINDLFISAKTKYPELCCRFVDLYYSKYAFLLNHGPDVGSEYTLGNDKFALWEFDEQTGRYQAAKYITDMDSNDYVYKLQYLQPSYTEFGDCSVDARLRYNSEVRGKPEINKLEKVTLQERYEEFKADPKGRIGLAPNSVEISYIENLMPYRAKGYMPYTYRSVEESQMLEDLKTVLEPYIIEQFARFVTGARPLNEVEKFQGELKTMGMNQYLQFHIDEYARVHQAK